MFKLYILLSYPFILECCFNALFIDTFVNSSNVYLQTILEIGTKNIEPQPFCVGMERGESIPNDVWT